MVHPTVVGRVRTLRQSGKIELGNVADEDEAKNQLAQGGETGPLLNIDDVSEARAKVPWTQCVLWHNILPSSSGMRLAMFYALLQTGIGIFRGIFASYHMNMYLTVYKVSSATMASVHSVFAIWNPINDLIGAWVSDTWAVNHCGSRVGLIVPQILVWPTFCVLPFWPFLVRWLGALWLATLALCVEDTFFSFVMIAMGGMWTDITKGEAERVKIGRLEKILHIFSMPLISINYRMWTRAQDSGDIIGFASYYSMLAFIGFSISVVALWQLSQIEETGLRDRMASPARADSGASRELKLIDFVKSLPRQKNLWCFIIMSALNEVQVHFNSEFAAIFADINLRNTLGVGQRSIYLLFEQVCLFASTILCSFVAQEHGVYRVYLFTALTKFLVGLVILLLPRNGYLGASYHLLSSICTGSTSAFFIVIVGNLVDEYRYNQGGIRTAASVVGLYFGLHALVAKPLDSLGPVIGTYVLEDAGWTGDAMKGVVTEAAELAGYRLIIGFPVICGALQLSAWYFYDLHGEKLRRIQESLA